MNALTFTITVLPSFPAKAGDENLSLFAHALLPVHKEFENLHYPVEIDVSQTGQAALSCKVPLLGFSFYAIEVPTQKNELSNTEGTLKVYYHELPALTGASKDDHLDTIEKAVHTVLSVFEDTFSVTKTDEEIVD
jgi:hypothetical protein